MTAFPPDSPLHAFSDDEVAAIFAAATARTCAAGEAILTEGEPGDSMFFLVEGRAEARLATGKNVRAYGPGSYFGELSFINPGHRRSTTVVATEPSRPAAKTSRLTPLPIIARPIRQRSRLRDTRIVSATQR